MTQERDRIGEIQDRLRRIETRLTKYMQERGFDTQVQKPVWRDGEIYIPSLDVRLRDILEAVPDSWCERNLDIFHQDNRVGMFVKTY